ncbi:3-isopropylmalate dehydratase large subunit [Sphingobium sufflavum]|uniref:3-isopropylmalate dehydratase large subunit n=1 Tax=Sphingobium sufflavum TaxID=1129547 RepID=UPI001F229190|nr:3-isopropylmalate dehydratase large subunit [Sphingobium sufflavum]MCE7798420.1 3-isopropylmalate dehydratase large subunit [Sphingobium sufflavum]
MTAPRTLFDKLWDAHRIATLGEDSDLILIDRILLHERTGGIALKSLEEQGRRVNDPAQVFVTMDHVVDTLPGRTDATIMPTGTQFITATRDAARRAGLTLFDLGDPGQGIVHVISPEQGIILPGLTLVCPDSHTCSQGALGGLAWGIGSSEAEHALATSTLRMQKPRQMRIMVTGILPPGTTAKDLALHILRRIGSSGAHGHMVEYAGPAIAALEIEARLTLCNMATELSAFSAIIAPDDKTAAYLAGRRLAPKGEDRAHALAYWRTLATDTDATFDREEVVDATQVRPMVSWGTSPQQAVPLGEVVPAFDPDQRLSTEDAHQRALAYMGLPPGQRLGDLPIDAAFIGSCTNSRLSDLRRAAAILRGRHVAQGVRAICVPGSTAVKAAAEAEGLDRIFLDAGFEWREAGCSMCFFAGGESFGPEERVVTSTNRNFESRQGPRTRSHLASPETVAASAVTGRITAPADLEAGI